MPVRFEYRAYRTSFRQPLLTAHGSWSEREGIIVRLLDDAGHESLGEIAPLPDWGTETLADALRYCAALPGTLDEHSVHTVPDTLPCCQFALETAWEALARPDTPAPVRTLPLATLLPAGAGAVAAAARACVRGYTTMKWKVGVASAADELSLLPRVLEQLPPGGQLRIDANGAWDLPTARLWLAACTGHPVEFIEQPFPLGQEESVFALVNEFPTRIALDESVAVRANFLRWLEFGWPGIYVLKPSLAGSPRRLLQLLDSYEAEAVFSGAFETVVGVRAALQVVAHAGRNGRASGFGTIGCFADERLNLPDPGPTLSTKWLARQTPGPLWEHLSTVPRAA
jgi:O-succinylbenzoate synthase